MPNSITNINAQISNMKLDQMTPPPSEEKNPLSQKSSSNHSDEEMKSSSNVVSYIESLKDEREQLAQYTDGLHHVFNLIDKEIKRVTVSDIPTIKSTAQGSLLSETLQIPVDLYPNYNFVGRILGPRGTTAKQLETTTGCKIVIHGRKKETITSGGDAKKQQSTVSEQQQSQNQQQIDPLTIEISCPANIPGAEQKLEMGINVVKALLVPPADGQDELKRQQLMVLANMKGTYRPRTLSNNHQQPSLSTVFNNACGDYSSSNNDQFQNLLPFGYHLPISANCQHEVMLKSLLYMGLTTSSAVDHLAATDKNGKNSKDCENPKCAILRSLVGNNVPLSKNFMNNRSFNYPGLNNNSLKMEDVVSAMKWYEVMNRIKLASLVQESEVSKAKEISKQMCSTIENYGASAAPTTPIQ